MDQKAIDKIAGMDQALVDKIRSINFINALTNEWVTRARGILEPFEGKIVLEQGNARGFHFSQALDQCKSFSQFNYEIQTIFMEGSIDLFVSGFRKDTYHKWVHRTQTTLGFVDEGRFFFKNVYRKLRSDYAPDEVYDMIVKEEDLENQLERLRKDLSLFR